MWNLFRQECAIFTFSCGFSVQFLTLCLFLLQLSFFLPHDYTFLFQRVGRYALYLTNSLSFKCTGMEMLILSTYLHNLSFW